MNIAPGNMFENGFDRIVVTVNCVGVAGKGVALEFKQRAPKAEAHYRRICEGGRIKPGQCIGVYSNEITLGGAFLLCATKDHWIEGTNPLWCISILEQIRDHALANADLTIGMPPPGAGLGGLDPTWVLKQAQEILADCPNVYYHLPE